MYPVKFVGNRYILNNKGMWDGQCPYNIGHSAKMKIPNWRKTIMFNKWHILGNKVENRRGAKPYRLYWRLYPEQCARKKTDD